MLVHGKQRMPESEEDAGKSEGCCERVAKQED